MSHQSERMEPLDPDFACLTFLQPNTWVNLGYPTNWCAWIQKISHLWNKPSSYGGYPYFRKPPDESSMVVNSLPGTMMSFWEKYTPLYSSTNQWEKDINGQETLKLLLVALSEPRPTLREAARPRRPRAPARRQGRGRPAQPPVPGTWPWAAPNHPFFRGIFPGNHPGHWESPHGNHVLGSLLQYFQFSSFPSGVSRKANWNLAMLKRTLRAGYWPLACPQASFDAIPHRKKSLTSSDPHPDIVSDIPSESKCGINVYMYIYIYRYSTCILSDILSGPGVPCILSCPSLTASWQRGGGQGAGVRGGEGRRSCTCVEIQRPSLSREKAPRREFLHQHLPQSHPCFRENTRLINHNSSKLKMELEGRNKRKHVPDRILKPQNGRCSSGTKTRTQGYPTWSYSSCVCSQTSLG